MIIVSGEWGYKWRGLVMKVVLRIIFHCNLSPTVQREIVDLHFLIPFAALETFVLLEPSLYKECSIGPEL